MSSKPIKRQGGLILNPPSKRPRNSTSVSSPAMLPSTKTTLKFKSPAEFFAENKNIAGFDNPGKSLYTTIRELVENALDAAEAVDTLPDIEVCIERIDRAKFRSLVGIHSRDRVDHALYKDVENKKERKARQAREKREAKKKKGRSGPAPDDALAGLSHENESMATPHSKTQPQLPDDTQSQSNQILSQPQSIAPPSQEALGNMLEKRRPSANEIFRVTVTDNGSGMPHEDVPNMMGRVLAGTKYCVRQARGKFGLGSKMALIWAKMSTGLPVHIITATTRSYLTECLLDIDIANNVPTVLKHEKNENSDHWRGSKVSVTIEGNWTTYRAKIVQYMRQMAVVTPYAKFHLKFDVGGNDDSRDLEMLFARRTDCMPPPAREVKHHPSSVNQLILKQLIGNISSNTCLETFFTRELASIPRSLAVRLITELGPEFSSKMTVAELTLNHVRQIDALLHEARFDMPDGKCLSPAGEYNLRLGITKELQPNLVATHAEPADVFEGHPFIVEAGVALGGNSMKPGINIFRFANRIPLLFEAGNDVVTKTAREDIRWGNYKISTTTDRIGVICSIVSTKIPFKGTGKEYIGDDSESIKASVKRAITQCCLQLKTKLMRRIAQKDAAERKKTITRYAPDVANALVGVFNEVEDARPPTTDVVEKIQSGKLTKQMILNKLLEHVQQIDKEQAIEYAAATGRDQKTMEVVFASKRGPDNEYIQLDLGKVVGTNGDIYPPFRLALCKSLGSTI